MQTTFKAATNDHVNKSNYRFQTARRSAVFDKPSQSASQSHVSLMTTYYVNRLAFTNVVYYDFVVFLLLANYAAAMRSTA